VGSYKLVLIGAAEHGKIWLFASLPTHLLRRDMVQRKLFKIGVPSSPYPIFHLIPRNVKKKMGLAPPIHLVGKVPQALKKLFLAIFPYVCNEQTCEIYIYF
jgi:hypothetical protein